LFYHNYFEFDDIIPNQVLNGSNFFPQNTFPGLADVALTEGDPLTLDYSSTLTATDGNVYQWYRNGTPVGDNSLVYSVASSTAAEDGSYHLEVTNPGFEELTLATEPMVVTVEFGIYGGVTQGDYEALEA